MVNSDHHASAWNNTTILIGFVALRLPAHERGTPGEAAAHGLEQQQIALLHASILDGDRQRQRDRRGGRVAVQVDGQHHLLRRNMKLVR